MVRKNVQFEKPVEYLVFAGTEEVESRKGNRFLISTRKIYRYGPENYETMVFGEEAFDNQRGIPQAYIGNVPTKQRYDTWRDALKGHAQIVDQLQKQYQPR